MCTLVQCSYIDSDPCCLLYCGLFVFLLFFLLGMSVVGPLEKRGWNGLGVRLIILRASCGQLNLLHSSPLAETVPGRS